MSTLRDLPIRQKLLAITMITIAVALVLAGASIVIADRVLFRAGMERDLSALASIIGDNSTAALAFDDPRVAGEILGALKARPHVDSACIYKPDGTTFASYARAGSGGKCQAPTPGEETSISSQGLIASHPILLDNRRVGTLVMLYDAGELAERTKLYIEIVLAILLVSSLLAFALSSRLREIIGTPISRLAHAASSVSQHGDYSVRVEKYSHDELGVLVDTFNEMLSRVQSRDIEVQAARNSLQTTLASIGDAVISTDTKGHVVFTNPIARGLLRWPEQDLAGKHIDDVFRIVNEFSRQQVEVPVHRVLREGTIVGLANHTVLIARDGTEVPIDDSAAPIRDANSGMLGVVLVFRDISERRRADASARLLASIVESSDDAIISTDLNGVVTSWNKGAERIFGYSADEAIGNPISVLAAHDRPDEMPGILEHIKRGERVEHLQTLRRAKSGKLVYASITVSPIRDANGQVTGASKMSRDITEQVEAQALIAEQRERLRVTLSSIGDAVMATDASSRISYLNPIAEQLTGWTSEEADGRPLEEVFRIINEESRQTVENPAAKALREGRIIGLANHTLLLSRNGKEIPIDDSAAPIQDADGNTMGVVLVFRDITERRNAERRLAEQSEELRRRSRLLEQVHCFVRDLDDRVVFWNQGATDLYGFSADEAIGQVSHSLLKTIFPMPLDQLQTQLTTTGQWTGQLVHTRRDGGMVTVASNWTLHRGPNDQPATILEVNTDVTELRQAEEAFRALVEDAPFGIYIVDSDFRIAQMNLGSQKGAFRNVQPVIGRDFGEAMRILWPESVAQELIRAFRHTLETGEPYYSRDFTEQRSDVGIVESYEWELHRIALASGKHGVVCYYFDSTRLREAEETARLRAAEVQALVDAAPVFVWFAHDADCKVITGNQFANELLGVVAGTNVSQTPGQGERSVIKHFKPDGTEIAPHELPMQRAVASGEVIQNAEFEFGLADGRRVYVAGNVAPLFDSTGKVRGCVGAFLDITDRKLAEEQRAELRARDRSLAAERTLREREAELARVVRALSVGELATSIAHEINQPLAGVVTNAEAAARWLSGEKPNMHEARESLALIARDGNRASAVIRRIREFLRKGNQETSLLDINDVVQEAVALARPELLKRKVTPRIELSSEPWQVRGDRIQLQQVVLNLIMNGAEAMGSMEGAKELRVTSQRAADGSVVVAVRDLGAGINPEDMPRMFDAFFTTKPTGMGMGLSISRTIIEAHGGRIWVEVNDGRGLTVQFGLPAESFSHAASEPS